MAESQQQKRVAGRVMHAFKDGELKSGADGKGGKVKSRNQAIAIALSEAGASNCVSRQRNAWNLKRSERNQAGADGKPRGWTRPELYARARKQGIAGRSGMSKAQLESALGLR